MRGRVGCTFNKMIRLGFFKLSFDKMLKGNRVSTQRYLAKKKERNRQYRALLLELARQFKEQQGSECAVCGRVAGAGRGGGRQGWCC